MGFFHHEARISEASAKKRDLFLHTDLDRLLRTVGGGIQLYHDIDVREPHLSSHLLYPLPMWFRKLFQHLTKRKLFCAIARQRSHTLGQKQIHAKRFVCLGPDLSYGISEFFYGKTTSPEDPEPSSL